MNVTDAPVGIVGGGPVGLAAAARLASFGVASVLLEKEPELVRQGSKACLIQGDVLEVLDKFGCAQPIVDEGVTWNVSHTYARDTEITTTVFPTRIGPGPFVNISQHRIEQVLLGAVETSPLCDIRWSHRVVGIEQDPDGVIVHVESADRSCKLRFRYLIGCDGVRGAVREFLGVRQQGYRHRDQFLITDIRAQLPRAKERHFHYDPPFNRGRQVVIHPQPDDVWRVDIQLRPHADVQSRAHAPGAPVPPIVDRHLRAVIGDVPYTLEWWSTYGFHQRIAEQFAIGRVFLAGDAAHAFPPYGSRGMNSGIQDVDNLAWKLMLVVAGNASANLLASYHDERHAAARENLALTEATIRFMVPPNRRLRLRRDILLRLATRPNWPGSLWARSKVDSGKMAQPFVYAASPIIPPTPGHPLLGAFAPDGWVIGVHGRSRIRQHLGLRFVAICFDSGTQELQRFLETTGGDELPVPLVRLLVLPSGAVSPSASRIEVVHHADAALRRAYFATVRTAFLIRPDGHVAAAFDAEMGPVRFLRLLERTLGGTIGETPPTTNIQPAHRPATSGNQES